MRTASAELVAETGHSLQFSDDQLSLALISFSKMIRDLHKKVINLSVISRAWVSSVPPPISPHLQCAVLSP
jgi:hypothetical protein